MEKKDTLVVLSFLYALTFIFLGLSAAQKGQGLADWIWHNLGHCAGDFELDSRVGGVIAIDCVLRRDDRPGSYLGANG